MLLDLAGGEEQASLDQGVADGVEEGAVDGAAADARAGAIAPAWLIEAKAMMRL
ncbi:hypothetical protein [Nannocystis sp.]|uniref:hypothetical protein n=1 Tax=Nannocystis sp. TaxID=1962667 RepID=UPI0025D4ADA4|nr:hypothetical protein [Nannocystis sp.]